MTTNTTSIFRQGTLNNSNDKITETLSKYTEKKINKDKSVTYTEIPTTYFLENNTWDIDFFGNIEQFKEQVANYKYDHKNIHFSINNKNLNTEIKFIIYNKLFTDEWGLQSTLKGQSNYLRQFSKFINEKYPNTNSMLELNFDKANIQWIDWLNNNGIKILEKNNTNSKLYNKDCMKNTAIANFFKYMVNSFCKIIDERDEWEKDKWDIRNLERYGINYSESSGRYFINFSEIDNIEIRKSLKQYIKLRLLNNNKFSWNTAIKYLAMF